MTVSSPSSFKSLIKRLLPLAGLSILGVGLWMMLGALKDGHYDPRAIGAPAVLNRPVPSFTAKPLSKSQSSFDSHSLKNEKKPVLVVFFSSWCVTCLAEMPVLQSVQKVIPLWGVDYDDSPSKGRAFIEKSKVAFERLNADEEGLIGASWGLTGVPESFLILPGGKIVWHAEGPLRIEDIQEHILPLIQNRSGLPPANLQPQQKALFPNS